MSVEITAVNRRRATIARPVRFTGISVRSAAPCWTEFIPAPAGTGVVFKVDGVTVAASHENLVKGGPDHTTAITANGVTVMTVEHLLAAIYGAHIDDLLIRTSADGIAFADFSSEAFTRHLRSAGRQELAMTLELFKVTEPFHVSVPGDDRYAEFFPSEWPTSGTEHLATDDFRAMATTDFPMPIGRMSATYDDSTSDFAADFAWARSFVRSPLDADGTKWSRVRKRYPMLPTDPQDSPLIAFDDAGFVTPLKSPDEPCRHKMVDLLGDLMLAGRRIAGEIMVYKPGHSFNALIAGEVLRRASNQ